MKKFTDFKISLQEGVYDKGILKAFFLAGGPGSGKSFVTRNAFAGSGLKLVNSDRAFENNLKKANLSMKMPDEEAYFRDMLRKRAKTTTASMMDAYLNGRLGIVVDGTARDYDLVASQHQNLTALGYDNYMIFVNTSLEVALERNEKRSRSVPEYIVKKSWDTVQSNIGKYQRLFGMSNFIVIDNNRSEQELLTQTLNRANKVIGQYLRTPVKNYIGKSWISKELQARKRM